MPTDLSLSKRIAARTKTVKFRFLKKDFSTFGEKWRRIRSTMRDRLDKCWWCKEPFKDGDTIALAIPEAGKNRVLCQGCADQMEPTDG